MLSGSGKTLLLAGVVVCGVFALALVLPGYTGDGAEADVAASHYEDTKYEYEDSEVGVNEYVIRSYGDDPMNEQRAPEATARSWWSETIIHTVPEDEPLYLNVSIVYRPGSSGGCETDDLDEFGIDRGNDWEGERRTDTEVVSSLKDSYTEFQVYDEWRNKYGEEYGPLIDPKVNADNVNLEKTVVVWYNREDVAGDPPRVEHGDRFVAAQGECWVNPSEPGWYRWAAASQSEYENGTARMQTHPDFSHWFWICDCANESEAREVLGPPPHERSDEDTSQEDADQSTPTPTATPVPDDDTPTEAQDDTPTPTEASDNTPTATATEASGDTPTATEANDGAGSDGANEIDGGSTPTAGGGPGFGPIVAITALVGSLLALRRRR